MGRFFVRMGLLFLLLAPPTVSSGETGGEGERGLLFREEFRSLERWEHQTFPKIDRHSSYSVEQFDGGVCLRAESSASASGILYRETFSVYEYPKIRWRWRTDRVYGKGDARKKSGDDYPLRIYVLFRYDPARAGILEKVRYEVARLFYGTYPPHSALNYVWANREHGEKIFPNAYSERAMMILKRGPGDVGSWHTEEADILRDYRQAFGEDPPREAGLALINDSDDTGEGCTSYVDFIELYR